MSSAGKAADIADVLVSEEVRRIRGERWSGVLALAQGDIAKGLYFVDGEIVFAASTVEEDRLGANLYRIGRITEAQFRAAMAAVQAPGRRLGQALLEAGVLRPAELEAAVIGQAERIVLSVLRWTSGRLQRRAMDRPLPADLILDFSTPRLLLLGARFFPKPRRLEAVLGLAGTRLRRISPAPFEYEQVPSSPPELAVLAYCAREATVGEVLSLPHPRSQLLRAAYALVAGGMLETLDEVAPAPVALAPAPAPAPERATPAPSPASTPTGPAAEPATEAPPDEGEDSSAPVLPSSPEEGEVRAKALLEKGHREAAVELLRKMVEKYPEGHGCRRLLAMTLAQAGGFEREVERHFLTTLEAEPEDTELRHRLATYYRRAGMGARAMLQLRLVLSVDPGHAGAWRDLGELEAGEGGRGR